MPASNGLKQALIFYSHPAVLCAANPGSTGAAAANPRLRYCENRCAIDAVRHAVPVQHVIVVLQSDISMQSVPMPGTVGRSSRPSWH